jgi:hypothetical protein
VVDSHSICADITQIMNENILPAAESTTRISLVDIANRYLEHYQRLFDISAFSLAGFRKASEQDYDELTRQLVLMPKNDARMSFEKAKDVTETWLLKHVLTEALGSVVPLLEDSRSICALCDYKVAKINDSAKLLAISNQQRQEFLRLSIGDKFNHLKQKYGITCDVQEHVESLLSITRALLSKDGVLTQEEAGAQSEITLKIRSITLVQANAAPSTSGEAVFNLTRKVTDNTRKVKVGDKVALTKAEQFGSLMTLSIFLATMLQGVQNYALKTGAADQSTP